MRCWLLLLGMAGLLPAQSAGDLFNRAPAGVDEAARARVTEYFTLQMEGKFRQAEALVCEAGKDAYYDMEKTRWKSFEIVKSSFEDDFQTGKIVVLLGTMMPTPHGLFDAKYPYASTWKLEDGKWCFFIDPVRAKERETPFGKMTAGPDSKTGDGGRTAVPTQEQVVAMFKRGIRVSPNRVRLSSFEESSARVNVTNTLQGEIDLELIHAPREGLAIELNSPTLAAGQATEILLRYSPPDKSPKERLEMRLRVRPSGQEIPITVDFALPQELIDSLPEALRPKPQ